MDNIFQIIINQKQNRNSSNKVRVPKGTEPTTNTLKTHEGSKKEERRSSHEKRAIRDVRLRQESLFFEVCIAYKCLGVKSEQHAPNESGC